MPESSTAALAAAAVGAAKKNVGPAYNKFKVEKLDILYEIFSV